MYNSIYPVNINYHKNNQYRTSDNKNASSNSGISPDENSKQQNSFPNGTKVAIDYTKGQINISQVLADFRSTIIAINAPDDVKDEVSLYLGLVEKESLKENPSRDIILSNLKNASKVSDAFITSSLKKPSNVVEGWIDALFLQKINLKSNPNEINPDFLLEFPEKAQERIEKSKAQEAQTSNIEINETPVVKEVEVESNEVRAVEDSEYALESKIELSRDAETSEISIQDVQIEAKASPFDAIIPADVAAKSLFIQAKKMPKDNKGDTQALNLLNEALGEIQNNSEANKNIRAAIHFERGKIFDNYDYVDYALRDYWEATKTEDYNLKAQSFYKIAQIYDEFSEFDPALDNYLSTVAYCAEADNVNAQVKALVKIASLYAKQFDMQGVSDFGQIAIDVAKNTNDDTLIAQTHSQSAQNFQYIGENDKAINEYKNALSVFSRDNESYEDMAYNYEQAALVMKKLGNHTKASKLQLKANLYYQKAQQDVRHLAEAS